MGDIVPFQFESHQVRIIDRNDEEWWMLSDVCVALDIVNAPQVASRLDVDEKDTICNIDSAGGPDRIIISEAGLYKIIMTSRKPVAKRFDRWVRHVVLPSIRKTGSYGVPAAQSEMVQLGQMIVTGMKEAIAPLGLRLDSHDQQFTHINNNMVTKGELNQAKYEILREIDDRSKRRQNITPKEKEKHWRYICHIGGRCPICKETEIAKNGDVIRDDHGYPIAEVHHWYTHSDFTADQSIPVCKAKCHPELHNKKSAAKAKYFLHYESYQIGRREFEGAPAEFKFGKSA